MKELVKCCVCDKYINLLNLDAEHNTDILYYRKKYYHKDCFINYRTNLKRGAWNQDKCNEEILTILANTNQHINKIICNKELYNFLSKNYNVVAFSKYFCEKINQLQNGNYPRLTVAMPIEDLYDMWQQKIVFLNKTYAKNKNNGKDMTEEQRLNYDLAILINKYNSYLNWKQRQKENKAQMEKEYCNKQNYIDYSKICKKQDTGFDKNKSSENIDINSILDEI